MSGGKPGKLIVGRPCKHCGIPYSAEFVEQRRIQKGQRVKESLAMAKSLGEPVGRPRSADREKIRELRKTGMVMRKIAQTVGCSLHTVQRALSEK